jgi:hypothetical protein
MREVEKARDHMRGEQSRERMFTGEWVDTPRGTFPGELEDLVWQVRGRRFLGNQEAPIRLVETL